MRTENDRSLLGFLARGVTTTHPLCSVFTLLILSVFIFVCASCPTLASAEAFPIPPVWLPMNPYNAQGLHDNYVLLNDDQKEIVKEVIGAANIVNLGFGQYVLQNPIVGIPSTRQFLREYGGTFLETLWTQVMGTSRAMTDFVGSTIYKASTYDTLAEYEADTAPSVASGSQKYFQISPELTVAFKNWYRANGGVEDWQQYAIDISDIGSFTWSYENLGSAQQGYDSYIESQELPHIRTNLTYVDGSRNAYINGGTLASYRNLFIDTLNGYAYVCNDSGNAISDQSINCIYYDRGFHQVKNKNCFLDTASYNITGFNTIKDAVEYIFSNYVVFKSGGSIYNPYCIPSLQDLIQHIFVGNSWAERRPFTMIDDLNIGSTPSEYIDNIPDTGYVDINTLIGRIADEVVNLREVVEDSVLVKDGTDAIPYSEALTKAIDKYMTEPESKVVIVPTLFKGLGKYITYLYEQAKPLVLYTRDLLTALTFDGTGMSWVFYGAVSCGLIGGVLCKFLL